MFEFQYSKQSLKFSGHFATFGVKQGFGLGKEYFYCGSNCHD